VPNDLWQTHGLANQNRETAKRLHKQIKAFHLWRTVQAIHAASADGPRVRIGNRVPTGLPPIASGTT